MIETCVGVREAAGALRRDRLHPVDPAGLARSGNALSGQTEAEESCGSFILERSGWRRERLRMVPDGVPHRSVMSCSGVQLQSRSVVLWLWGVNVVAAVI